MRFPPGGYEAWPYFRWLVWGRCSMLLLARRASSVRQDVWDKLLSFLPLRGLSACDASVGVARDFLLFYAVTYMWKYGTLFGCRSALHRPLLFVSH